MIQCLLGRVLSWGMRWVDDTVAEDLLHGFMRARLQQVEQLASKGEILPTDPLLGSIARAAERLNLVFDLPDLSAGGLAESGFTATLAGSDSPLVQQGKISPGGVDAALGKCLGGDLVLEDQMEPLLRHIEVRRRAGLQFAPALEGEQRWLALAKTSLLFTCTAAMARDQRYLNAAIKLNDWGFGYFCRSRMTQGGLWFLLAVLEAEAALLETA